MTGAPHWTGFDGLTPTREIIGIVKDTHDRGLASEPYPTVYIPFTQFALPYGSIALRARVAPERLTPAIRDRLNRLNPSVPLSDFQRLDTHLHESLREPRFYTMMAVTCASMAVLFVTCGLYGLLSYAVSRRTSELGIRMAVGAKPGATLRLVLLQGLRMTGAGVALGLGLSLIFTRALRSLLFEVHPLDPLTISAAAAAVVAITLAASIAPGVARAASIRSRSCGTSENDGGLSRVRCEVMRDHLLFEKTCRAGKADCPADSAYDRASGCRTPPADMS